MHATTRGSGLGYFKQGLETVWADETVCLLYLWRCMEVGQMSVKALPDESIICTCHPNVSWGVTILVGSTKGNVVKSIR